MTFSPQDKQELEQELAKIRDTVPRLWWNLYQGCLVAGFSERQAFVLLQTKILGEQGVYPPREGGPEEDDD
jgi:hypothetical protein